MKISIGCLGVAIGAITLGICWATGAAATEIRVPQSGPVAFVAQLANGWTYAPASASSGNLEAPDKSSVITLVIGPNDPKTAAMSDDELANTFLLSMNAPAFTKKEPALLGGVNGYSYLSETTNSNNVTMNVQLYVIKPIGQFVAIAAVMSELRLNDAQSNSLEAMKKGVTLSNADN